MQIPTFTITHLILNYIVRYEVTVTKINALVLPPKIKQELYENTHADDIHHLGELVHNPVGFNKALRLQQGKDLPSKKSKLRIFSNYRSAHDFIKTYESKQFIQPSTDLLIHLNKLVLSGLLDEWEVGKLRNFSDKPNEIYDNWYKLRDFHPQINVADYFNDVFEWVNGNSGGIHKLIKITILLYELIDKAPLFAANQLTSLLIIATLLKEYKLNPDNCIPVAKSISFIDEDLMTAFKISKSQRDLTPFLEAFLYTLSIHAIDMENQYTTAFEDKVKNHATLSLKFNPRQIKVLDHLKLHKKITRKDYSIMMGTSFMTSYRDLQNLVDEGFLSCEGVGRGTFYVLKKTGDEKPKLPIYGSIE